MTREEALKAEGAEDGMWADVWSDIWTLVSGVSRRRSDQHPAPAAAATTTTTSFNGAEDACEQPTMSR